MFYNFDYDRWIIQQLPPVLRRPALFAFLRALLAPLRQVVASFGSWREATDRQLTYNGQTIYLQKWLNDLFYFDGQIYITDEVLDNFVLAKEDEAYPPVYVTLADEAPSIPATLSSWEPDDERGAFVVHVPAALSQSQIDQVRLWTSYYKYSGTQFRLESYE